MRQQWIKLRLKHAEPTGMHYSELKDPMSLKGGKEGEVGRYMLEIGGLREEMDLLAAEGLGELEDAGQVWNREGVQ